MRGINLKKSPAIRKILRLFAPNGAYGKSSIDHDEKRPATDPVYLNRFNVYTVKATNSALLEAERKKAEAFMQRKKHSFIC
ncbi:MAG: hypothetical protein ACUVUE_08315 [Candidatus Bathycorpusculaceae bacterium]